MVQATELRIGNWLFYGEPSPEGKHYIDVYAITKTGINGSYQHDADMDAEGIEYTPTFFEWVFEDLHPIPLTPEILEAAGFETKRVDDIFGSWAHYQKILNPYKAVYLWQGAGGTHFRHNGYTTFMHYLHQLQNLYFALTGEELTINF